MTGSIKNHQQGISIIEIVASMAVFIIALTLALSILIVLLNNPQLLSSKRGMEREMQNIADQIIFDFRNYTLDYDYYTGTIPDWDDNTEIALRDKDGRLILYEYSNSNILYSINGGPTTQLNGDNIDFTNVKFIINPHTSPWIQPDPVNDQPSLTLLLESRTNDSAAQTSWLQTSVMSRNYFR